MKIFVTVNAGSGKTTFSKQIANKLGIELINLDKIVWLPGWKVADKAKKENEISNILKKSSWIVEGVSKTILTEADVVIFLDYPSYICYYRAFKRNLKYLFHSRPELPKQCPEILVIFKLIKIIWNFPKYVKPNLLKQLDQYQKTKQIIHITKLNKKCCKLVPGAGVEPAQELPPEGF